VGARARRDAAGGLAEPRPLRPSARWRAKRDGQASSRRRCLASCELREAECYFKDSFAAFSHAGDATNAALVLINHAAVCRSRATQLRVARVAEKERLDSLLQSEAGVEVPPRSEEVDQLGKAVQQQRRAVEAIRPLRGSQPRFWEESLKQLADDEAVFGTICYTQVGCSVGGETAVRLAGESFSKAQVLYEELGEMARVQQMMARQGALHLLVARREKSRGIGREKSASSRLTLALRHYERATSSQMLATASQQMMHCAASCHLELAKFYLNASGSRLKHLEAALGHARDGRSVCASSQSECHNICAELADQEQRALRELLRVHSAAGNVTGAAQVKEAYRQVLNERLKHDEVDDSA